MNTSFKQHWLWMALALTWSVASARPFTASDLVTLREIGNVAVSADGRWVTWDQRETDLVANDIFSRLWLLDLEHPDPPRQLSPVGGHNFHHPRFSADGEWIYFLSDATGVDELWRLPMQSGAAEQVTDFNVPITGYALSPTGREVAIWADVSTACNELPCELPQPVASCCGSGRGFDDAYVQRSGTWRQLQARSTIYVPHRDEWMMPEIRSRIFVMSGDKATSAMGRWLGDAKQGAWSADGKTLFFTLREARREERFSLDLDVIAARVGESTPTNLTVSNPEVDALPAASPDGRWLAYVSAGALQLRELATGTVTSLTTVSARSIAWTADSRSLLVTARVGLDEPLFQISLDGRDVTRLTTEGRVTDVIPLAQGGAVFALDTMLQPADLYRITAEGKVLRLTAINEDRLRDIETAHVERFDFKGAKGATVSAWMIAPETHRGPLPTVLLIHDGAYAGPANSWSRHRNPLLFSAPGYAVIGIDFHSNGQRLERDKRALEDLRLGLSAVVSRFAAVDPENVCIVGDGAYGGYLAYRIAGEWPRQPRCLIANGGVVDAISIADQTDEPWMHDWQQVRASGRNSALNPLQDVDAWRTPLLILHGEKNFRVPYAQSLAAFTAAQRRNVPSRLVVFPDEGVQVQTPKNTIQWVGEVFNWLDRWLLQRHEAANLARWECALS
jgi:dipeptidyl aminopeptidase/acylaminoacyl peptidase